MRSSPDTRHKDLMPGVILGPRSCNQYEYLCISHAPKFDRICIGTRSGAINCVQSPVLNLHTLLMRILLVLETNDTVLPNETSPANLGTGPNYIKYRYSLSTYVA